MFVVPVSRVSRYSGPANRHLARLFDDSLEQAFGAVAATESPASRSPALDVTETEASYTVTLEVPGVVKDDVKVSVEGRQVTVQASTPSSAEKKEGERVIYRERGGTRYARTITLPADVDQAETVAKLEHGVLTLTLPKRSARSAAQISVN